MRWWKKKPRYFLVSYKDTDGYGCASILIKNGKFVLKEVINCIKDLRKINSVVILSIFELTEEEYKLDIE